MAHDVVEMGQEQAGTGVKVSPLCLGAMMLGA
jgi:aryl-alcohol dehydrogenase-like predicted oxidoreductase